VLPPIHFDGQAHVKSLSTYGVKTRRKTLTESAWARKKIVLEASVSGRESALTRASIDGIASPACPAKARFAIRDQ